jgi:hypothetical protein
MIRHCEPLRWRRRLIAGTAHDIRDHSNDFRRDHTDATFWLLTLSAHAARHPNIREYTNASQLLGDSESWGFRWNAAGETEHLSREQLTSMFKLKTSEEIREDFDQFFNLITPRTATGEYLDAKLIYTTDYNIDDAVSIDDVYLGHGQLMFDARISRDLAKSLQIERNLLSVGYHIEAREDGTTTLYYKQFQSAGVKVTKDVVDGMLAFNSLHPIVSNDTGES